MEREELVFDQEPRDSLINQETSEQRYLVMLMSTEDCSGQENSKYQGPGLWRVAGVEMKPDKPDLAVAKRRWEPLEDINCKFMQQGQRRFT